MDARLAVASPTSSTGTFEFTLRVPMGGFFGTNILLTRIQWQDASFGPQEVVLPEWFQVIAPDGKPVLDPKRAPTRPLGEFHGPLNPRHDLPGDAI